jgi:hypothetical protein
LLRLHLRQLPNERGPRCIAQAVFHPVGRIDFTSYYQMPSMTFDYEVPYRKATNLRQRNLAPQ